MLIFRLNRIIYFTAMNRYMARRHYTKFHLFVLHIQEFHLDELSFPATELLGIQITTFAHIRFDVAQNHLGRIPSLDQPPLMAC